jgi:hypothetical protein
MGLSFRDVVSTARRNDMPDILRCQLAVACRFSAPSVPHHYKTLRSRSGEKPIPLPLQQGDVLPHSFPQPPPLARFVCRHASS